MSKGLKNIITLILGMIIGFIVIFFFSTNQDFIGFFEDILPTITKPDISITLDDFRLLAIFFAICFVLVFIITQLIRFFTSTKNLRTTSKIMNVFVELILGVPLTTLIFAIFEENLLCYINLKDNIVLKLVIWCLIYSIIFEIVCASLEASYLRYLKKGHKRCKLTINEVINSEEFHEKELVIKKMTFEDCYNTMKNLDRILSSRQFYRISEMNWNNKKEVDKWNYFSNLNFIQEEEKDLCRRLLQNEEMLDDTKNITWQG